jgi:hypothetical protein
MCVSEFCQLGLSASRCNSYVWYFWMKFIMDVYKEKYFAKYGVFFTFVI